MKERPILFSAEMVRAILAGRKTQTRRVVKPQSDSFITHCYPEQTDDFSAQTGLWIAATGDRGTSKAQGTFECPYGVPGNRLWVRETWWTYPHVISNRLMRDGADTWPKVNGEPIAYAADGDTDIWLNLKWIKKPSIFMPRWASRITLEVKEVRIEKLQEISEEDCLAEGCPDELGSEYCIDGMSCRKAWYADLWDSINNQRGHGWKSNPFVWAITYNAISDETRAE